MSDTARLFLALWPDPAVRAGLIAWRDGFGWPRGATPVHDDKLHLTLHFIGDTPRERIPALREQLRVPFQPFELGLGTALVWPRGIAVLEPDAIPAELLELHRVLGETLNAAGLPPEARPYKPHVTMARRAVNASVPASGPAIRWRVDGYALMESLGGRYTALQDYGKT
ncbi:MAG: RNA 2',3'-cyclic phosphodiesterase [Gammaproteobacteria bacterium]